jgi:SWI/SNF-related matrix-associated actin-dependent regulator 1 of chromatin subfamily A
MYQKRLSGILADEMGLGKTCQVISFLGVLLERDIPGPHLIVVPASTLENWLRELTRFCPSLKVEPYYGSQRERADFRDAFELKPSAYNVMVTTYQLAAGAKEDRSFLRKQKFDVCVYDEGHNLKNSASARYNYLMALPARFRLLLTGTPLQNNLKELISLLAFVLPMVFHGNLEKLNAIFKIKAFSGESKEVALLSQQRIDRAKQMMTPFVLRRYKNQVLDDMPAKHYRTDTIELDPLQREIYDDLVAATRKAIEAKAVEEGKDLTELISTKNDNILMQLRKVSNHPMLFRKRYDDGALDKLAKALLKEQFFIDQGSEYGLLIEDMQVMSDYELNRLCKQYEKTQKFALVGEPWMEACKVSHLQRLIPEMRERGDRILLFSQFTQTLDILEDVLNTMNVSFFRLDGSTDVAKRQDMIDQFYEEEDVTVFLLSTKAGGFGINLACANVVIIYDSSYNPHDDKQAEDRAHRVGQKREVNIIRLVCKGTIEEDIQALAQTKLMLDMNVSGTGGTEAAEKTEAQVAQKLLSGLIKADKESTAAPESSSVSVDAGSIKDVKVEEMTSKPASVKSAGSSPLSSVGST